jgi:glycosyltransferase involved in cell wall biosynthesis
VSRLVHVITPGDHFSPRTGSAVPTVVHGLSGATPQGAPRPAVVVARGTYLPRYGTAEVLEYDQAAERRRDRYADAALARLGLPRAGARRAWAAALAAQDEWDPCHVLLHNAPEAVALVDTDRHIPVLYAHNQLLRTYSQREAGRALEQASRVVCVSAYLAAATADRLPPSLRERVRVVTNGVDAEAFAATRPPREAGLRVAYLGRVVPDKGVHVLLEAARLLARRDLAVTIVGRPGFAADAPVTDYEASLHRLARDVPGGVTFTSFLPRPELPPLLARQDVVVVPSVWPEPFALAALEGMAAGAAVVASDVGGIPEAVGDAGTLVSPGDAAALAGALRTLADEPAALAAAQERARAHAREHAWPAAWAALDRELNGR